MGKTISDHSSRPVALWLLTGVGMLVVQILLGGITRLSGSGLSITEWNVITGALPPFHEQEWLTEFDKYKQTPQFHLLNFDFTLQDFKFIFFWEWLHRFWARLMGVVFAIPFVYFLLKGWFKKEMVKPLIILFLLGALQGAVGWIMVASGLTGDAIYVKPAKLALHFIFALGLLCYTYWFALLVRVREEDRLVHPPLRKGLLLILFLLGIQLLFGALMAGHKAATAAPTWPDINGSFLPSGMNRTGNGLVSLLENKITIHFIHRTLGYLVLILVAGWTARAFKTTGSALFDKSKRLPLLLTGVQVLLGILSVITSTRIIPNRWGLFEWMAQLHQLVAILLLLSLIRMLFLVRGSSRLQATSR